LGGPNLGAGKNGYSECSKKQYIYISKYYISINEIKDISKYIQLIYYIYLHIFEFERLD
jgi:hypothetical protein